MDYSETALQKVRDDRFLIDRVDLWLFDLIEPFLGKRILEIGCGMGNFAQHLTDRELYIGTDISAESVDRVNNYFGNQPNILTYVIDASDKSFQKFSSHGIDTIFSLNVFEHISDDRAALINAVSVLEPDGNLILVVPAHKWLLDRWIGPLVTIDDIANII